MNHSIELVFNDNSPNDYFLLLRWSAIGGFMLKYIDQWCQVIDTRFPHQNGFTTSSCMCLPQKLERINKTNTCLKTQVTKWSDVVTRAKNPPQLGFWMI